jgi:predicted oxidoreductase
MSVADDADVIIVGAGLAGLVAAAELVEAAKTIIIVDQEPEQSLGGQAFWSLGGIFLVDSPEQRGHKPMSLSPRARSDRGCTNAAFVSFPLSAGRSAAATMPLGTATPCQDSI